jgi:hypothetical protein
MSESEWHLLWYLEGPAAIEQAIEVDMHSIASGGIDEYVLHMSIAESKHEANHAHDCIRPGISQTSTKPSGGLRERFEEPLVKDRWKAVCRTCQHPGPDYLCQ